MRSLCVLFVLLAGIFQLVAAQGSNAITVPPNGFQVTAGQGITIDWTNPSLRTVTIQLIPASAKGQVITLASTLPSNGSATVLIPSDVPTTQQYQFKITDDSNSSNVNFSPAFNITPSTSGLPTSTSAASSTAATAASTSSNFSASTTLYSLSAGAIAGISIGAVLAVLLLAGIAIFFLRRRRKHKSWMQQQQQPPQQQAAELPAGSRALAYDMNYQYDPMNPQTQSVRETVVPLKATDQWAAEGGVGGREPSEVSGSGNWPREMEGTSRFQQREVVELPASPIDAGGGVGKK